MSDLVGIDPASLDLAVPSRPSDRRVPLRPTHPDRGASAEAFSVDLTAIDRDSGACVLTLADLEPGSRRSGWPAGPSTIDHAVAVSLRPDTDLEDLAGRWLTPRERSEADRRAPRGRVGHILGRVAAKRAALAQLDVLGLREAHALRVEIINDDHGCPRVGVRGARIATRHLAISIAHTGSVAVALATAGARRTGDHVELGPGIDIEAIEPRSARFERLTLTESEQSLAPMPGDDRDTWLTRLWSAKEAAAKATGRGLRGRPKDFVVVEQEGERLRIADRWILTERVEMAGRRHVIATTDSHRTECSWRS